MRGHVLHAAVLTASLMIAAAAGPTLATEAVDAPAVTAATATPAASRHGPGDRRGGIRWPAAGAHQPYRSAADAARSDYHFLR